MIIPHLGKNESGVALSKRWQSWLKLALVNGSAPNPVFFP
jgi:hypothetical protein